MNWFVNTRPASHDNRILKGWRAHRFVGRSRRFACGLGILALAFISSAPASTTEELSVAFAAKILCSGVFVSNLDQEDVYEHSVEPVLFFEEFGPDDVVSVDVDYRSKHATISSKNNVIRTAAYRGREGCVILPADTTVSDVEPLDGAQTQPAEALPWPSVDESGASGADAEKLRKAIDAAFRQGSLTAAFIVVHKGNVIVEEYAQGADRNTPLASWSMGKSLIATLLGVLIQQDKTINLYGPAPVPEWEGVDDPRRSIRIIDLLRMSSGLEFSGLQDPREEWRSSHPDHLLVYSGGINVFDFAASRPLEYPPNTVGRYRNSDPLMIGRIIKHIAEKRGEGYLALPSEHLFKKIDVRTILAETDPHGNYIMTGYVYGAAVDWARLGQLYLNDGVWQGERLLPPGWRALVTTPAPAWDEPEYGGLFWLNYDGQWNLPEDAFYMAGGGGQFTIIVPSLDLLVVRMGHYKGGVRDDNTGLALAAEALNDALLHVVNAID